MNFRHREIKYPDGSTHYTRDLPSRMEIEQLGPQQPTDTQEISEEDFHQRVKLMKQSKA